jgi:lipopolysaccharide/colanic/teichoic acid biosynthesis glycosyltransferase
MKGQNRSIKDFFDIAVATAGLPIFIPLLLILSFLLYLTIGQPVLFRQKRAGKGGRPFIMYKLRTMFDLRDQNGRLLPDEKRVTSFGKILRLCRLDELPELFNIIRGDMSFVGPRPTIIEQVNQYDGFKKRRLSVKPGLTGWAQINGNTKLSWDNRIFLDIWYVDHWSLSLDLRIIFATFKVILCGEIIQQNAIEEAKRYANSTYRRC